MEWLMQRAHLEISSSRMLRAVTSWVLNVPEDGDSSLPLALGTRGKSLALSPLFPAVRYTLYTGTSQTLRQNRRHQKIQVVSRESGITEKKYPWGWETPGPASRAAVESPFTVNMALATWPWPALSKGWARWTRGPVPPHIFCDSQSILRTETWVLLRDLPSVIIHETVWQP